MIEATRVVIFAADLGAVGASGRAPVVSAAQPEISIAENKIVCSRDPDPRTVGYTSEYRAELFPNLFCRPDRRLKYQIQFDSSAPEPLAAWYYPRRCFGDPVFGGPANLAAVKSPVWANREVVARMRGAACVITAVAAGERR